MSSTRTSVKAISLETLSLIQQEALVCEDLLNFVLLGISGNYIKYGDNFNSELQFHRLLGPEFVVTKSLHSSIRDSIKSWVHCGQYYYAIEQFYNYQASRSHCGRVNQALCAEFRNVKTQYLIKVADLIDQLAKSNTFRLSTIATQLAPIERMLFFTYQLMRKIVAENERKKENGLRREKNIMNVDDVVKAVKNEKPGVESVDRSTMCKGGSILKLIAQEIRLVSAPEARKLYKSFLSAASQPYITMLESWLNSGLLDDPDDEFLISEAPSNMSRSANGAMLEEDSLEVDYLDEYWEKRYKVKVFELPLEIADEKTYSQILLTGKYLNVLRETEVVDDKDSGAILPTNRLWASENHFKSIDDPRLIPAIGQAYQLANVKLRDFLMKSHMLDYFKSIRHFYLLYKADYLNDFMDKAGAELAKPASSASIGQLQNMFDYAVSQPGSASSSDSLREKVHLNLTMTSVRDSLLQIIGVSGVDTNAMIRLRDNPSAASIRSVTPFSRADTPSRNGHQEANGITALQGLELHIKVPFPISLIFPLMAMTRYQMIFRHLVNIRQAQEQLNEISKDFRTDWGWKACQCLGSSRGQVLGRLKRKIENLRFSLSCVLDMLFSYCTAKVLEPAWNQLEQSMSDVPSIDVLIQKHISALDTAMKECLLTDKDLLTTQASLIKCSVKFIGLARDAMRAMYQVDESLVIPKSVTPLEPITHNDGQYISAVEAIEWLNTRYAEHAERLARFLTKMVNKVNEFSTTTTGPFMDLSYEFEKTFRLSSADFSHGPSHSDDVAIERSDRGRSERGRIDRAHGERKERIPSDYKQNDQRDYRERPKKERSSQNTSN